MSSSLPVMADKTLNARMRIMFDIVYFINLSCVRTASTNPSPEVLVAVRWQGIVEPEVLLNPRVRHLGNSTFVFSFLFNLFKLISSGKSGLSTDPAPPPQWG